MAISTTFQQFEALFFSVDMLLCALFLLPLAWAQFPAVCNTQDSLSTKTCCPDNCGSHGTCESIREEVEISWNLADQDVVEILRDGPPNTDWPQDVRYQWPIRLFERVCLCQEGWGGYDCSRCDFGFIANVAGECVKRKSWQRSVRQNYRFISDQERRDYITLLELAKNQEEKEWAVPATEPAEANGSFTMQNVSAYDMLVYVHALAVRGRTRDECMEAINPTDSTETIVIDFGHYGTHFLTWHRYYVLLIEDELRKVGEKVGITDFTMPYYDFTPTDTCLMFTYELLGTPVYSDVAVNVSGALYEDGKWPVVCDRSYWAESGTSCGEIRALCNVEQDRLQQRSLQRGSPTIWEVNPFLPSVEAIEMVVAADEYAGNVGFANRLEGNVELCAGEAVKCLFRINVYADRTFNNLHNAGHVYFGGHMENAEPSANDPWFPLLHANVDRVLESWMQKFSGDPPPYLPTTGGHPGTNLNDYHVPLFPLKTSADMYKETKELGYTYDGWIWHFPTSDFPIGCANHTEANTCDKGGYHPQCRRF